MTQRTLPEKVGDIKSTYHQYAEMLTAPEERELLDQMTGPAAQAQIAALGDPNAYVALVQASLSLRRVQAANNRAALIAAVMTNGGNPARVQLEDEEN